MPPPRLPDLLARLDRETHAARCRRVAAIARPERETTGLGVLLDGLAAHSDYHAVLAVMGAAIAGDLSRLERLAEHPAPRVARAARSRLPLPGSPAPVADAYLAAPPSAQRLLRRRLADERRTDVVDLLIRADLSDTERAGLLALASAPVAAAHLPDLADLVPNPATLTKRHPDLVLAHLRSGVTDAPSPVRDHWWTWAAPGLGALIGRDPGAVLSLLESAGPTGVLTPAITRSLGALLRRDPHRTAVLIAHPRHDLRRLPSGLCRYAARLAPADRVLIAARLLDREEVLARFLDALPPSERAAVVDGLLVTTGVGQRLWPDELLDVLPRAMRHREARRLLDLPSVRGDVFEEIRLTGFLPADEAIGALAPFLGAANADERGAARVALVRAAAGERHPPTLAAALDGLTGLRNERDPVRLLVADALAEIPGRLLLQAGLAPLEAFVTAAVTARDCSAGTRSALERTAWSAARAALDADDAAGTRGALRLIDALAGPTGLMSIPSFAGVRRGGEQLVIAQLLPRIRVAAAKDDYLLLFALCHGLGERAWGAADLDALLAQAVRAPQDHTVRRAAEQWLADPATRAARVADALRIDESLAVLPVVQQTLIRQRQDLLGVLWKRTSLAGRLWGRRPAYVPVLAGPFTRWLPRQVQSYADALAALIATEGTGVWTATSAIRTLGRLPGVGGAALEPHLDSPDVARREAAIAALAWTDRPADALARLLAVRSGDEVRVAMYAAGRCLRDTPAPIALPLVLDVLADPATKVTARKEAVRLLGLIRDPVALDHLIAVGRDATTHRDVRIAVARTVRAWLDDDRSWQVSELVADSGREGVAAIAETQPTHLAERHRARYARLLLPGADTGDPALVAALGTWAPWLPEAMSLLGGRITDVTAPGPHRAAAAIRVALRTGSPADGVLAVIRVLADRARDVDLPDAGDIADRPARQRVSMLVATVTDLPAEEMADHRATLAAIVGELAPYGDLRGLAITTAARAVDWAAPLPGLESLIGLDDDPLRCADLRHAIDASLTTYADRPTPAFAAAIDALLARADVPAAVAALSGIAWAGRQTGWAAPWRERIRVLRRHGSPVVAAWARDVVTAPPVAVGR